MRFPSIRNWMSYSYMAIMLLAAGCGNKAANKMSDSRASGVIHISVDESFKPIIDSQIKVFEALNPEAKVVAHYKPEAECLKDMIDDSTRMVIITRQLTQPELEIIKDTLRFFPSQNLLAFDAITAVVHKNAKDTLLDMTDIRSILKGTSGYKYKAVMDGLSATGTVRYMLDSVLRGQPFDKNSVMAAKASEGVIDYVSKNENAIGFVGVSWIGNPEDSTAVSFSQKVNIAAIECRGCTDGPYVKPYQANIAMGRYPMIRPLYYILKENYDGLGSGFADFLINEKGQLIFRRAYLWPASMSFDRRNADLIE